MTNFKCLGDVLPKTDSNGLDVIGAIANNMVVSLHDPLIGTPELEPLTRATPQGFDIYRDSLVFLLAKCSSEIFPKATFRVRHSIGPALYCSIQNEEKKVLDYTNVAEQLKDELTKLVEKDVPIKREIASYKEAIEIFTKNGRIDEAHLLKHRNPPAVVLSHCEDFFSLNQTVLVTHTGALDVFDVVPVEDGIVLNIPSYDTHKVIEPLPYIKPYFQVFREHLKRGEITGISTIGDLNQSILEGRFADLVRTIEALQTKNLAEIADKISSRNPLVKLVLVAGPSSAGKTTTSHRLCTQLRVNGRKPQLLSTDDYFVGDARNPRDENGELDYETVKAVDAERLAADIEALFSGKNVRLRKFDFIKHAGYDDDKEVALPPNGIIVLEGIHALNPELTRNIPDDIKFGVYLNALTQLVVDSCNRISTKDTRLLRRLVRDAGFRGMPPIDTFRMWPKVEAGERKWIYPYQRKADAVFNSALDYELAVLKPFALQLLNQVKPWHREYLEARRLSGILHNVSIAPPDVVPGDSILRETIGGSQLSY